MKTICPHCGQRYEIEDEFIEQEAECTSCLRSFIIQPVSYPSSPALKPQTKACPMCGEEILAVAKKCKHCGERLEESIHQSSFIPSNGTVIQMRISPPKSRAMYVVLGLFLGLLGIHDYYAGFHKYGTLQLLATILLGWTIIIPIICGIMILFEILTNKEDSDGIPFY